MLVYKAVVDRNAIAFPRVPRLCRIYFARFFFRTLPILRFFLSFSVIFSFLRPTSRIPKYLLCRKVCRSWV